MPFLCSFSVSFVLRLAEQMKQTEDPLTQLRLRGGTIAVKQDGIVEQIRQGRLIFPQRGGEQRDRVEIDEQAFIPALRAALRAAAVGTACRWSASWNAHLDQLQANQYDQWLQWYQDFLDKKF